METFNKDLVEEARKDDYMWENFKILRHYPLVELEPTESSWVLVRKKLSKTYIESLGASVVRARLVIVSKDNKYTRIKLPEDYTIIALNGWR